MTTSRDGGKGSRKKIGNIIIITIIIITTIRTSDCYWILNEKKYLNLRCPIFIWISIA
jgi:hypothetical protein